MVARNLIGLVFILMFTVPVFSQNKDAVLGKWLNASGEGQIMIYKNGSKYYGKLIWLKNPEDEKGNAKLDKKNSASSLKSRPLSGLEILKNFEYQGDSTWDKGTIYDPKTGKTYNCILSMISSGELDVRGYVGFSMFGKTETWTRVR